MTNSDFYELLDFGNGRKIERFGAICLDRPAPAADAVQPANSKQVSVIDARFRKTAGGQGQWHPANGLPKSWPIVCGDFQLLLKPTPFGHVGVFPEQVNNWRWIADRIARRRARLRLLNLFAHTGASTLAAAAAGAEVVHVDSARNVVQWARQNALASGLSDAPIRWITEDARRFVAREIRRGNRYQAIVLDPPSYGHGPKGETWQLSTDLMPLLSDCRRLLSDDPAFLVLTCHSSSYGPAEVGACLQESMFGRCSSQVEAMDLSLRTEDGRELPAGVVGRWPGI